MHVGKASSECCCRRCRRFGPVVEDGDDGHELLGLPPDENLYVQPRSQLSEAHHANLMYFTNLSLRKMVTWKLFFYWPGAN